jgi:hypothetical protein
MMAQSWVRPFDDPEWIFETNGTAIEHLPQLIPGTSICGHGMAFALI